MKGVIKKKTDRGFGFIAVEGQEKDLFFHSTALNGVTFDQLQEGSEVTFEVQDGSDGRQSAKNVMLADAGSQTTESEATETSAEAEMPAAEDTSPREEN